MDRSFAKIANLVISYFKLTAFMLSRRVSVKTQHQHTPTMILNQFVLNVGILDRTIIKGNRRRRNKITLVLVLMTDLFKDLIPAILQTKKDVFSEDPSYKAYNSYMVNKALSNYVDTVMSANNMNMSYHLHKKAQWDYYINNVRAMRRPYAKWFKAQAEDDLEAVKLFFGYSAKQAREAIKLLTEEQIDIIRKRTTIGG